MDYLKDSSAEPNKQIYEGKDSRPTKVYKKTRLQTVRNNIINFNLKLNRWIVDRNYSPN